MIATNGIHFHHMRMGKAGSDLSLFLELLEAFVVVIELISQDFQSNLTIQ